MKKTTTRRVDPGGLGPRIAAAKESRSSRSPCTMVMPGNTCNFMHESPCIHASQADLLLAADAVLEEDKGFLSSRVDKPAISSFEDGLHPNELKSLQSTG